MSGVKPGPETIATTPQDIQAARLGVRTFGRRGFLRLAGTAGAAAVLAPFVNPSPKPFDAPVASAAGPEAAPLADAGVTPGTTERIRQIVETRYTVDQLGYRVSNAYKDKEGFLYVAYQGAIIQQDPNNGDARLWNSGDEAHKLNLDARLDNGSLGVTVPPYEEINDNSNGDLETAYRNRLGTFRVPADVAAFADGYRKGGLEIGVFTSHGKDYGGYTVWRTQRIAIQKWNDGRIQRILLGDALKNAGLVPKEAQLSEADLKFGDFSGKPIGPAPEPAPQPTPETQKYNFPGYYGLDAATRENVLNGIRWAYGERHGEVEAIAATGKLMSVTKDGDKVIVTVATNKGNSNETHQVVIEPKDRDGLRFTNAFYIPYYQTSNPEIAYQAILYYLRPGDPIQVSRYFKGDSGSDKFSSQQIKVQR